MAKGSDNPFPSVLLVEQAAAPAAPAAGQARLYRGTDNKLYMVDDAGTATQVGATPAEREVIGVALSDETTAITTGTAKATLRMPFAMMLTEVRASLTTASSASGPVTVDINEGGVSILSTKLTIDDTEKTSTTGTTPAVVSDAALADDAEITFDIDTAGTGATGLKVWLIGTRA